MNLACDRSVLLVILLSLGPWACGAPGKSDGGPTGDYWLPINPVGAPIGASVMVWMGEEVAVFWGPTPASRYNPSSDTWRPMAAAGSTGFPVWTGTQLYTMGADGVARYDPVSDAWTATSTTPAPAPFGAAVRAWTGVELIAWGCGPNPGGPPLDGRGIRYELATDVWTEITTDAAPGQSAGPAMDCSNVYGAWIDGELFVVNCGSYENSLANGVLADEGRYDPATDTWVTIPTECPTSGWVDVWTGDIFIRWEDGFRSGWWDPADGSRGDISTSGQPELSSAGAVLDGWTGAIMLVWGEGMGPYTGARYHVDSDTWSPMTPLGAPPALGWSASAVWTGTEFVVWGSTSAGESAGGRYYP